MGVRLPSVYGSDHSHTEWRWCISESVISSQNDCMTATWGWWIWNVLWSGTIMTISKDHVKPSRRPDRWKLNEIFATGVVMGTYLALVTVLFYWAVTRTTFFEVPTSRGQSWRCIIGTPIDWRSLSHLQSHFKVRPLKEDVQKISSAMYLQISIISQALIFVTRSRGLSFLERPGALLICAFVVAQLVILWTSGEEDSRLSCTRV